jgi:hypothetical protein
MGGKCLEIGIYLLRLPTLFPKTVKMTVLGARNTARNILHLHNFSSAPKEISAFHTQIARNEKNNIYRFT